MDLSAGAIVLLTVAGFVAGAINAAAGGGSLVSFPALVALGHSPLIANVTNNVGVAPGYFTGEVGARLAQKVSDRALRVGIVAYGVAAAIWFFLR